MDTNPLGRALRVARVAAGKSVQEAAERIGKSRQTLSTYEREEGGRAPDDATLEQLATFYDTTSEALKKAAGVTKTVEVFFGPAAIEAIRGVAELPQPVRVWLQQELLEYAEAGVSDEEIRSARRFYESPEFFSLYAGGRSRTEKPDRVLANMRAHAIVVRRHFREKGYRVAVDTDH